MRKFPKRVLFKNRNCAILLTILSAFFYAATFLMIDILWFLLLPSIFLLAKVFTLEAQRKNFKLLIGLLALWGGVVFMLHFLWLPIMFRCKLGISWILTVGLFLIFIFFFISFFLIVAIALTSAAYSLISSKNRFLVVIISALLVVMLMQSIQYCPISIIGQEGRYQLMSPMVACHAGIDALSSIFAASSNNNSVWRKNSEISDFFFMKVSFVHKNVWQCAAYVQKQWQAARAARQPSIVLTPESWLPLPLNEHAQLLWQFIRDCPKGGTAILATQHREKNGDRYQALYWIDESGVRGIRRKRHAIAFVEKMPAIFEKCTILRSAFHADEDFAVDVAQAPMQPWIIDGRPMVVYVCSEFFLFDPREELLQLKERFPTCIVAVAVNDSYFASYVVALLKTLVRMRQRQLGMPVIYVGYS